MALLPQTGVRLVVEGLASFQSAIGAANAAVSGFGAGVSAVGSGLTSVGGAISGLGSGISRIGRTISIGVTAPLALAGRQATKLAAEFEASLTRVITLVGISADEVAGFRDTILQLSAETAKAPVELSEALFTITSAGARGAEALAILEQAAKASAIGLGETQTIARTVVAATTAFADQNLTAAEATAILVSTVRAGNLAAEELSGVLGKILGPASALGISFEELGASIATYTRLGVSAAEAATGLRSILSTITKPTESAKEAALELGISFEALREAAGRDGLQGVLQALIEVTGGNIDIIAQLFPNVRALSAVLGTAGTQGDAYAQVLRDIEASTGRVAFVSQDLITILDTIDLPGGGSTIRQGLTDIENAFLNVSEEGAVALETLGFSVDELTNIIGQAGLGTALDLVTTAAQELGTEGSAALETLIGTTSGLTIAQGLAELSGQRLSQALTAINTASRQAGLGLDIVEDGFRTVAETSQFQFAQARASFDAIAISIGQILIPAISDLLSFLGPIIERFQTLAAANPELTKIAVTFGIIVAASGPVLLIFGALVSALGTIITAVGSVVVVVGGLISTFGLLLAPIAAIVVAIGGLAALFIASFGKIRQAAQTQGQNLSRNMFSFGRNIIIQFARGMAAALSAVITVLNRLGQIITDFLITRSPPKLLPDIDDWGKEAFQLYIDGFADADFGVFNELSNTIEGFLRSVAIPDDLNLIPRILGSRTAVAAAVDELREVGQVSEETFRRIFDSIGRANPALREYIVGTLALESATRTLEEAQANLDAIQNINLDTLEEAIDFAAQLEGELGNAIQSYVGTLQELRDANREVADAQREVNEITDQFDDVLTPLQRELRNIRSQEGEIRDAERLQEVEEQLANTSLSNAERQSLELERQRLIVQQQIRERERERDVALDAASDRLEAAEEEQSAIQELADAQREVALTIAQDQVAGALAVRDAIEAQVNAARGVIDATQQQNDLLKEQLALLQQLAGGGGGGGGGDLGELGDIGLPGITDETDEGVGIAEEIERGILEAENRLAETDLPSIAEDIETSLTETIGGIGQQIVDELLAPFEPIKAQFDELTSTWGEVFILFGDKVGTFFTTELPAKLEAARNSFETARDRVTTVFQDVGQRVEKQFAPIINVLKNLVGPAFEALGPSIESFKNSIGPALAAFAPLGPALQKLFEALKPIIDFLIVVVAANLALVVGVIVGVVAGILKALSPLIEGIAGIITGIVTVITGIINIIVGFVQLVIGLFQILFTGQEEIFRDGTARLVEGVTQLWTGLVDIIVSLVKGFILTVSSFLEGFINAVVGFFTKLYDRLVGNSIVTDLVDRIIELWNGLVASVLAIASSIVTGIIGFFIGLVEKAVAIWDQIRSGAIERWNVIKEVIAAAVIALKERAVEILVELLKSISEKWEEIKTNAAEKYEEIKNTIVERVQAFITALIPVLQKLIQNFKDKWEEIKTGASEKFEEIKNFIISKVNEWIEAVREFIQPFVQLGIDLLTGLKDGIASATLDVIGEITGVVNQVVDAVKALLGIASPSTVFASFGRDVGKGFIQGLESTAPEINDSISSTLGEAIDTASDLVGTFIGRQLGIANMFSTGNLGFNNVSPDISPNTRPLTPVLGPNVNNNSIDRSITVEMNPTFSGVPQDPDRMVDDILLALQVVNL